jgi:hypothetical protein
MKFVINCKSRELLIISSIFACLTIFKSISVLKKLLLYCGPYQGFSYYIDKVGLLNLVFRHDKTVKWSRILGKVYANLLERKLNYHTELELSQNSVIIKILEKNVLNI